MGAEYAMPGVHVNQDTLNALQVSWGFGVQHLRGSHPRAWQAGGDGDAKPNLGSVQSLELRLPRVSLLQPPARQALLLLRSAAPSTTTG